MTSKENKVKSLLETVLLESNAVLDKNEIAKGLILKVKRALEQENLKDFDSLKKFIKSWLQELDNYEDSFDESKDKQGNPMGKTQVNGIAYILLNTPAYKRILDQFEEESGFSLVRKISITQEVRSMDPRWSKNMNELVPMHKNSTQKKGKVLKEIVSLTIDMHDVNWDDLDMLFDEETEENFDLDRAKELVRIEDNFGWDSLWLLPDGRMFFPDRNSGIHKITSNPVSEKKKFRQEFINLFQDSSLDESKNSNKKILKEEEVKSTDAFEVFDEVRKNLQDAQSALVISIPNKYQTLYQDELAGLYDEMASVINKVLNLTKKMKSELQQ